MAISWEDDGVVLAVRRFGEHDAICTLLTASHGRTAGMVKGGSGKNGRSLLQPGNQVRACWRARLDSQLGVYTLESIRAFAARALDSPAALAGVAALCAMAEAALPEREPHDEVYRQCLHLLEHIGAAGWDAHYVLWELALLRDMGYGLDLGSCAATGVTEDLAYVSVRTGGVPRRRGALSQAGAAPAGLPEGRFREPGGNPRRDCPGPGADGAFLRPACVRAPRARGPGRPPTLP